MKLKHISMGLLFVFGLSFFSFISFADRDTGYNCVNDEGCLFVLNNAPSYCSDERYTCFLSDNNNNNAPAVNVPPVVSPVVVPVPAAVVPGQGVVSAQQVDGAAEELNVVVEPSVLDDQLIQLQLTLELLQEQSASVEQRLAAVESGTVTLSQGYQSIQTQLAQIQSGISNLSAKISAIESEQLQSKKSIKEEVKGVATGLASLQSNLDSTKDSLKTVETELDSQTSKTAWLTILLVVLLVLAVGLGLYYYMNKGDDEPEPEVDEQILKYITKHIKAGRKFPQVKEALLKAGWAELDINWAYKETLKKNYQSYLSKSGGSSDVTASATVSTSLSKSDLSKAKNKDESVVADFVSRSDSDDSPRGSRAGSGNPADKRKAMVVGIVSLVVIFGLLFLIRGITTGNAIYFQSQEELNTAVHDALQEKITSNPFYNKLDYALICMQVVDDSKAVSYKVTKTPFGHEITEAPIPCDQDIKYDMIFKFSNFEAFDLLANDFSCENARRVHMSLGAGSEKGVYVLPSRLVMPGFEKNPSTDYHSYCPIINECLNAREKELLDVEC